MHYKRTPEVPPSIPPLIFNAVRPLWSVMIPTYNCIDYIAGAISSVLSQDPGFQLMQIEVIDDGSTDGDVEAIVNEIGKGRVKFFKQKINQGSLRNFETCINRAKGYYVHILHGDDCVEPGFYNEIGSLFQSHPEAGAAFTNFRFIDHADQILEIVNEPMLEKPGVIPNFLQKIAQKQLIQPPAMVVKRAVYETLGSFYAVHFGEDWEMWARIASKFPVAYSPKYLASYRVSHGIGISYSYYLSGQNVPDIMKVIDIIQTYLPVVHRRENKKVVSTYYALYCIKVANGLLLSHERAAFRQVMGAWKMSKDVTTLYWALRFLLMYAFRYKQIEKMMRNNKQ